MTQCITKYCRGESVIQVRTREGLIPLCAACWESYEFPDIEGSQVEPLLFEQELANKMELAKAAIASKQQEVNLQ